MEVSKVRRRIIFISVLLIVSLLFVSGCQQNPAAVSEPEEEQTRTIVDMAGREVTLPKNIERIITLGPVPVLNGITMAMGQKDKIVNGLPDFAQSPRWKYQTVFAPNIADKPVMQNSDQDPNIEEMLKADPDVVITMNSQSVDILESNGIPVVFLSWKDPEDIKEAVKVLGEVFDNQKRAEEYVEYFDSTISKVRDTVSKIPEEERVKVLYCSVERMVQPHHVAEWWIETAGGSSVTAGIERTGNSLSFDFEQLLNWDPEIIIVCEPKGVSDIANDQRFSQLKAVKNNQVFKAPHGAHIWTNRTIEQPLTVLWAAKTFYPEQFKDLDLNKEVKDFYKHFFDYELPPEEIEEIVSGDVGQ
jgi:iron complex transport system substrate-binding protein